MREVNFVITPEGGWSTRRAIGRMVLGLMALSGPSGAVVVASLILLKERHHIARGIRTGIERIHSRSHRGRRVPPSTPPRRVSRPTADPPPPSHPTADPPPPSHPEAASPPAPSPESPTSAPGGVTAPPEGGPADPPGAERPPLVEVAARLELTPPAASGTSGKFDWQVAQRITVREREGSVLD